METTKLSSKGQVIIPKNIRAAHEWGAGVEFWVLDTEEGVLLRPKRAFAETMIEDVAGCLATTGPAKSLEEMEAGIGQAIQEMWHDSG